MRFRALAEVSSNITDDGNIELRFAHQGTPLLQVELTSPLAKEAARLQLLTKELEYCEALTLDLAARLAESEIRTRFSLDDSEALRSRAAYVAAVITYGKVFSQSGAGRRKLEPREVFAEDDSGLRDFHKWIMEYHRHNYVAHSNEHPLEYAHTVFLMKSRYDPDHGWRLVQPHVWFAAIPMSVQAVYDFYLLVSYVKNAVAERQQRQLTAIFEETERRMLHTYLAKAEYVSKFPEPPAAPAVDWERVAESPMRNRGPQVEAPS